VAEALVVIWLERFRTEMQPLVEAEREEQRQAQPKRRGHPKDPSVTGYLIGDDATRGKPQGRQMEGLGKHHATTHEQRIIGHRLLQGRSVLLDRRLPLAAQLDRQETVCETEAVVFPSTIALMEAFIRTVEPVVGTRTHVLLDRWYCATGLWRAARELITTGPKSNHWLRVADDSAPHGWRWQKRSASLARLTEQDCVQASWPRGGKAVYVPVVNTRVRKRHGCHVVIVRHALSAPLSQARSWASRDLEADTHTLLAHLSARRDIEVLFAEGKEAPGLDYSQRMSVQAQVALLDSGAAGLRLSGARAAPLAPQVAAPGDHWRSSTRDPASSSSSLALLAA
jgi:hypothetical protein